jgi:hypothetical protein
VLGIRDHELQGRGKDVTVFKSRFPNFNT